MGSSGEQYKALVPSSIQKILCPVIGRQFFHRRMLILTHQKMPGDPLLLLELSSMQLCPQLLTLAPWSPQLASVPSQLGDCARFCWVLSWVSTWKLSRWEAGEMELTSCMSCTLGITALCCPIPYILQTIVSSIKLNTCYFILVGSRCS